MQALGSRSCEGCANSRKKIVSSSNWLPVDSQHDRAELYAQVAGCPAYAPDLAKNVLRRSVFVMPMFGAVYPEKFEMLLEKLPPTNLRGVVIYSHGCGGQWGWETGVSQFFYRLGFAVITPEFPSRDGNKLGCPGANAEEALRGGGIRAKEGIYTAMNPARLAARATDVMTVVDWLKARTCLPILIGGHSEGCRTTYSLYLQDPQVVGGICVKQGLPTTYTHTWRWNTEVPMWQSLEEFDPWVVFLGCCFPIPNRHFFNQCHKDKRLDELAFEGDTFAHEHRRHCLRYVSLQCFRPCA